MRRSVLCVLTALAMFSAPSFAGYLEGVEYVALDAPQPVTTGDKVEVREFFMYSCPHCFHFEPALNKWLKRLPANARFVRTPVVFRPTLEPHARAYYAFEAMGVTDKLHDAFFSAIHVEHQALNDEDSIVKFVADHGVNAEDFRRNYRSFSTDADLKHGNQLVTAEGVDSVPTMVVDGKYRTNGGMTNSNENMLQVMNYLIKKAAAERKAAKHVPAHKK